MSLDCHLPCYFTAKNDTKNCLLLEFYLDDAVV